MVGVTCSLVAWGLVTDRRGERLVLLAGLATTAVAGVVAALSTGVVALALESVRRRRSPRRAPAAASGRVVVGWFPPRRRGLAMGIRQTARARRCGRRRRHDGGDRGPVRALRRALGARSSRARVARRRRRPGRRGPAATGGRPGRGAEPLPRRPVPGAHPRRLGAAGRPAVRRSGPSPWCWLVQDRGWSPAAAGGRRRVAQVAGVAGRIAAGQLSDVVGSRMRPLRWVTWAAAATMLALGADRRARLGGRGPAGRGGDDGHGGRQRPGVHRGGRAGRTVLVRPRPGPAEHRAVPRRRPRCRRSPGSRSPTAGYGATFALTARVPAGRRSRWCRSATSAPCSRP